MALANEVDRRRWVLVALIFLGTVISYVDRGNLSIAAATMMRDFDVSPARMGILLAAFSWAYGSCQVPAGAVVDRFGSRRVFAIAFFVWSLASAATALSRHMTDILMLRVVLGIAEAAGPLACLSLIRFYFRGPESGLPIAIYTAAQYIGPATGALLGTALLNSFGWRGMFAVTGLGAMFWLPLWLWLAPPDAPRKTAAAQASRPASVRWREVIANPVFWSMSACVFLFSYFWSFFSSWAPTYLVSSRGFTTLEMGRTLSIPYFAMAVVGISAGSLADRIIRRNGDVFRVRSAFALAGFTGGSSLLLLLVLPQRAAVLPVLLASMCSMGVAISNFWAISQFASPPHMVGRSIGYLNTISQFAGATAPIVIGWLMGPGREFGAAIAGCVACLAAAWVLLFLTGSRGLHGIQAQMAGEAVAKPGRGQS